VTLLPIARPIHVLVAGQTDRGRQRTENQDDFLVADLTVPPAEGGLLLRPEDHTLVVEPGRVSVGPRGALLVVADGMGGGAAGGLASRLATLWIYQELIAAWTSERGVSAERFAACIRFALERANGRIFQQSMDNPDFRGMGTTATVAGVLEDTLYLAQVGDSRAYLVREGVTTQLTRDQSMVQAMIEAGTLTEEEAERSSRRNVILQALGPKADIKVDLTFQVLRRGDVLVLCSDGLSRQVRREEIASAILPVADLPAACDTLVGMANERGGPDNITVVVAMFDGEGLEPPSDGDVVERRAFDLPE
jgi:serine/threonine protein phosphatase PrpC